MRLPLFLCALVALANAPLAAQPATPAAQRHAVRLIKLPNGDYTVPLSELQGSHANGKVTLHRQGLKTLVTVYVFGKSRHRHAFNLHSGKDCATLGAVKNIALAPAQTGQPSRTIVSLPLDNLMNEDYVISANDATARRQFQEACAQL